MLAHCLAANNKDLTMDGYYSEVEHVPTLPDKKFVQTPVDEEGMIATRKSRRWQVALKFSIFQRRTK